MAISQIFYKVVCVVTWLLLSISANAYTYYVLEAEDADLVRNTYVATNNYAHGGRYIRYSDATYNYGIFTFHLREDPGRYYLHARRINVTNNPIPTFNYTINTPIISSTLARVIVGSIPIDRVYLTNDPNFSPLSFDDHAEPEYVNWTPRFTNQFFTADYKDIKLKWTEPTIDQILDPTTCTVLEPGTNTYNKVLNYKIHWGTESRVYPNTRDVGTNTIATIYGVSTDDYTFYTITTIDEYGNESGYGCEVMSYPRLPQLDITPEPGTYTNNVVVSINHNAWVTPTIYYTLDGSMPYTNSLVYTGPITLNESSTLRIQSDYGEYSYQQANGNTTTVDLKPSQLQTVQYTIDAPIDTMPPFQVQDVRGI